MAEAVVESEAQVLRRRSTGEVIYIEVTHELVKHLAGVMHASVGGLAQSLERVAPDLGIVTITSHLKKLRSELWNGNKEKMIPAQAFEKGSPQFAPPPSSSECIACELDELYGSDLASLFGQQGYNGMYGTNLCVCCSSQPVQGGVCGRHLCHNCQRRSDVRAQLEKKLQTAGFHIQRQSSEQALQLVLRSASSGVRPNFQPTVRFIITNKLEIFENSSIKAIEIMGKLKVDMQDIETETVAINFSKFREMLGYLLLNSDHILTSCFPRKKKA
eukprot:m.16698 g.16698  ORF g.16698 m.16698 type:complete len:273 (-) comp8132_c0_seq1:531-1349(-)